jgi:hypothetical protein
MQSSPAPEKKSQEGTKLPQQPFSKTFDNKSEKYEPDKDVYKVYLHPCLPPKTEVGTIQSLKLSLHIYETFIEKY